MRSACRVAGIALACWTNAAGAHGFGQRFDLPLPLWLWVTGAGATIVLTFALIAIFFRKDSVTASAPCVNLLRLRALRWIAHPAILRLLRVFGVAIFVLTVCAGFFGTQDPYRNLAATMVWVVWWVGLAFVCALAGDLWSLMNPLQTLFNWAEWAYRRLVGRATLLRPLTYPRLLGAWPAVVLFLLFAWAELIWQENDVPSYLARAILVYAAVTWIGMLIFGRETWLENGEAFSVAFGTLARFAPVGAGRAGELNLRPPGAGLLADRPVRASYAVFVLLMLSTVTFDGFLETPLNQRMSTAVLQTRGLSAALFELSEWGIDQTQAVATAALLVFALAFVAMFWFVSWIMVGATRSNVSVREAACSFVLTLVPIAVAYHLSHYFSLLLTAGQFIIPLVSDPFGFGWNLFGTANYKVELNVVSPYVFWYSAVILIIVGHVIAIVLAHVAAVRVFGSRRAVVSQIPMVALMVGYTTLSLWILAQPIVG